MGGDNLPGLPRWQQAERLLAETDIYVYPRPPGPR
jgi:nicotinate-nucleotide adenylyltransferase